MPHTPERLIVDSAQEAAEAAALRFAELARAAVAERGAFHAALSGGSTPKLFFARLAQAPYRDLPWHAIRLWLVDERHVPLTDEQSNYRLLRENLLAPLGIETSGRPCPVELPPHDAARDYERRLRAETATPDGTMPRLDAVFLGLGEDGHTASLFPEEDGQTVRDHAVIAQYVGKMRQHRITLTLPAINSARFCCFLVTGSGKRNIVRHLFSEADRGDYPAGKVAPESGRLLWILDRPAAVDLV